MGLFDFIKNLGGNPETKIHKACDMAKNPKAIREDRWAALEFLADDAADAETIAAAKAEAEAARAAADEAAAKVGELQSLVDADTEQEEAITALLDSVELPS